MLHRLESKISTYKNTKKYKIKESEKKFCLKVMRNARDFHIFSKTEENCVIVFTQILMKKKTYFQPIPF